MADVAAENAATVLGVICPLYRGDRWHHSVWHHSMESSSSRMGREHLEITAVDAYAFTKTLTYYSYPYMIQAEGVGNTEEEAVDNYAKQMVANMLAADPNAFVFDPQHWTVPPSVVVRRVSALQRDADVREIFCAMLGIKRWRLQSSADPTRGAQA